MEEVTDNGRLETIVKQPCSAFILYVIDAALTFWFPLAIFTILTLPYFAWLIFGKK